jgi:hypothetical protein
MAIQFQCGSCGKTHQAKDELAGKSVKCPACSQPIQVPAAAAAQLSVQCPGCGAGYRLGAQLAGKVVKCKQCGGQIVVGGAAPAAARQHAAAAAGPAFGSIGDLLDDAGPGKIIAPPTILPGQALCPNCQKPIAMGSALCVECGMDFRAGKAIATRIERPRTEAEQARVDSWIALISVIVLPFLLLIPGAIGMICWLAFDLGKVEGFWGFVLKSGSLFLAVIGGSLTVLGYVSLLADALQEGAIKGLMFLFLPLYPIYFVATRWQKCRKTYINYCISASMCIAGMPGLIDRIQAAMEEEDSPAKKDRRLREQSMNEHDGPPLAWNEREIHAGWSVWRA